MLLIRKMSNIDFKFAKHNYRVASLDIYLYIGSDLNKQEEVRQMNFLALHLATQC